MNLLVIGIIAFFAMAKPKTAVNSSARDQGSVLTSGELAASTFNHAGAGTLLDATHPMDRIVADNSGGLGPDVLVVPLLSSKLKTPDWGPASPRVIEKPLVNNNEQLLMTPRPTRPSRLDSHWIDQRQAPLTW